MNQQHNLPAPLNRRQALLSVSALAGLSRFPGLAALPRRTRKVAGVVTVYQENSHADVICGKILEGYRQDGGPGPDLELVSLFTDQVPESDMSRDLARKHGFRICKSIPEAILLESRRLQVDGVLSIGEHGSYPYTPKTRQHMYPRRRFFDQIVSAFRTAGKVVPVFSDKHLAYNWVDAQHMYRTARKMKIPFMAGSSLPVAWREPQVALPLDTPIEEAVVTGYGGIESYGFHMLETMQCVVERRKGGETGVAEVQLLRGEAAWQASQAGRWSVELLAAAAAGFGVEFKEGALAERIRDPRSAVYLMKYRDGTSMAGAMIHGVGGQFSLAVRLKDEPTPLVNWFRLEETKPFGHFEHLVRAIEPMIYSGQPSYPVQRTLLTTGVLDRGMHSAANDGELYQTPELAISYKPADWPFANLDGKYPFPV